MQKKNLSADHGRSSAAAPQNDLLGHSEASHSEHQG